MKKVYLFSLIGILSLVFLGSLCSSVQAQVFSNQWDVEWINTGGQGMGAGPNDSATSNMYLPIIPQRFASVQLVDLDGDNDFDIVSGGNRGHLYHYKNIGDPTTPIWKLDSSITTLDTIHIAKNQNTNELRPEFADLDGDGDLDLIIGSRWADNGLFKLDDIHVYFNIGSPTNPVFKGDTISGLQNQQIGEFCGMAFGDLDDDGDLDLVAGGSDSNTHFENVGDAANPSFERDEFNCADRLFPPNSLGCRSGGWVEISYLAPIPDLEDLDADGDLDLLFLNEAGFARYIPNAGTKAIPDFSPYVSLPVPGLDTVDFGAFGTLDFEDVNSDGTMDVVATHWNPGSWSLVLGKSVGPVVSLSSNNISCNSLTDANIKANVSGGTTPYTYNWSNGATTDSISGLATGTYTVTVTDAATLTSEKMVTITEPSLLVAATVVDSNVTCNGLSDGGATSNPTGGTTPYAYLWSNSATTTFVSGVAAGSYTVTITDANGCTNDSTVVITQPAALTAAIAIDSNEVCSGSNGGLTASETGGTAPYTYLWSNAATSASIAGIAAGTYTVTITDNNGCTDNHSETITNSCGPDMDVVGNNIEIASGDNTPDPSDSTDFGIVDVLDSAVVSYKIYNTGGDTLFITNPVAISGTQAAEFKVLTIPADTILVGDSTFFTLQLAPTDTGLRKASLSIASNDMDENPYIFSVQGTGVGAPEIDVTHEGISIADGDFSPSEADGTLLDTLLIGDKDTVTYYVHNRGNLPLFLNGTPRVSFSMSHYNLLAEPDSMIAPGDSSALVIEYAPNEEGSNITDPIIANNDVDEGNYQFRITGRSLNAELDLFGKDDVVILDEASSTFESGTDFEYALVGDSATAEFKIKNDGNDTLFIDLPLIITGADSADFYISVDPLTTVLAGDSTTFTLQFKPSDIGNREAYVEIDHSDRLDSIFGFDIVGIGWRAFPDYIEVSEDSTVIINVQVNDLDTNLTTTISTNGANGTAIVVNGDSLRYTAGSNWGTDSVLYKVCDNRTSVCDSAWAFIAILPNCIDTLRWDELAQDEAGIYYDNEAEVDITLERLDPLNIVEKDHDSYTVEDDLSSAGFEDASSFVLEFEDGENYDTIIGLPNAYIGAKIQLEQPVEGLSFTVIDIDGTSSGHKDSIRIVASGPLGTVKPFVKFLGKEMQLDFSGDTIIGHANPEEQENEELSGNLGIFFVDPVDEVTVFYSPSEAYSSGYDNGQSIRVSDLTWHDIYVSAHNDNVSVLQNDTIQVDVLDNDGLSCENSHNLNIIRTPNNGTVNLVGNDIQYIPTTDFWGIDTVGYRMCDNSSTCDSAFVIVSVLPHGCLDTLVFADKVSNDDDPLPGTFKIQNITVTVTNSDPDGIGDSDNFTVETDDTQGGITSPSFFEFDIDSEDNTSINIAGKKVMTTFTFSPAVPGLHFIVADVDGEGEKADSISITANGPGGIAQPYFYDKQDEVIVVSANDVLSINGVFDVSSSDNFSNVGVFIPDSVSSLTLSMAQAEYGALDDEGSLAAYFHNFFWISAPPQAIADAAMLEEDDMITIDVQINDTSNCVLITSVIDSTDNGTLAVINDDSIQYTPNADWFGNDTLWYKITDPANPNRCDSAQVVITVSPLNDAPSFTVGTNDTINEDAGAITVAGWAANIDKGFTNEADQTLTFHVSNDNNNLFAAQPAIDPVSGDLTYTPATDSNGVAMVTVTLTDDGVNGNGNDSIGNTELFTIVVNAINDEPNMTIGPDQNINEDAGAQTVVGWATGIDEGAADEMAQNLTVNITTDNDGLFATLPAINLATGDLTYTIQSDSSGEATIFIALSDNGVGAPMPHDSLFLDTFKITVNSINDAPSFVKGVDENIDEDAGSQVVTGWATSIDKGASNEGNQQLTFVVTNDSNALFTVQPSIDEITGDLTYTPAGEAYGTATVTVTLLDNGVGAPSPNDSIGNTETFDIVINPINDRPSFDALADTVNSFPTDVDTIDLTSISFGPLNEAQSLTITAVSSDTNIATVEVIYTSPNTTGGIAYTVKDTLGASTVIVTVMDNGSNATPDTNVWQQTVVIHSFDTIPPIIVCPNDFNLSNNTDLCSHTLNYQKPVAMDNNFGVIKMLTAGLDSADAFPVGETTVEWMAMDKAGLTAVCSFKVTVQDTQKPVFTNCPGDSIMDLTVNGVCTQVYHWTPPMGSDNCDSIAVTSSHQPGDTFVLGTTRVTYWIVDEAGNQDSCWFDVMVKDTQKPQIFGCPSNILVDSDPGNCDAIVSWTEPTVNDNCSVSSFTSDHDSGDTFPLGSTVVTYVAIDGSGNTDTCRFKVTVLDTEKPVISCTANVTVDNDQDVCGAVVNYTVPTSTDNCTGDTIFHVAGLGSGALFPIGTTTETYVAIDAAGNEDTCSFTITVNDAQLPVIVCVPDTAICADGAIEVDYDAPVADDNCSGFVVSQIAGLASGSEFPVGVTTNTFEVIDASGNKTTCSFDVTINQNPAVEASVNNDTVCSYEEIILSGSGATTYSWNNGVTNNVGFLQYDNLVTYTVTGTDAEGCTATDEIKVVAIPLAEVVLQAYPDAICLADEVVPNPVATPAGGVYSGRGINGNTLETKVAGLGSHNIVYTFVDVFGCVSSDTTVAKVVDCTAITVNDINGNNIDVAIYPNPNSGSFTIAVDGLTEIENEVSIYNLLGARIKTFVVGNTTNIIQTEGIATGVYYVTVNEKFLEKVIVR